MSDRPDISVVMGVYNGGPRLRETMDSVLGQQRVNFEFIVVDDGSTDSTRMLLDEYAHSDGRVKVFSQSKQGLTKALISGCALARGDQIARQDVGDLSHPERLFVQKSALEADKDLAFVSSWTEYCGPEWEFLYLMKGTGKAQAPAFIISESEPHAVIDGPTHHGSVMYRRKAYLKAGGYRAEFYFGQDWDLWYRMAEIGQFQIIPKPLYKARIVPSSISMSNKRAQEEIAALSLVALRQRLRGLSEETVLVRAKALWPQSSQPSRAESEAGGLYFIGECLRRNGDRRALGYFKQSIRDSPLFVKSWFRLLQYQLSRI